MFRDTIIDSHAKIGKNVKIGDYTRICADVIIEDNAVIGDGCRIGFEDCRLNEKERIRQNKLYASFKLKENRCIIRKNAFIQDGVRIFNKVTIGSKCYIGNNSFIRGNCAIGDSVLLGIGVSVGPFACVGSNSKILNYTIIGSTSRVGKNVFISPYVVLSENKYMLDNYKKTKGPVIEDYSRIGALSTIISSRIGKYSIVGANSVLTEDLPAMKLFNHNTIRDISENELKEYRKDFS